MKRFAVWIIHHRWAIGLKVLCFGQVWGVFVGRVPETVDLFDAALAEEKP